MSRVANCVAVPGCISSRYSVLDSHNIPDIAGDLRPCLAGDSLGNCIRTSDSGHLPEPYGAMRKTGWSGRCGAAPRRGSPGRRRRRRCRPPSSSAAGRPAGSRASSSSVISSPERLGRRRGQPPPPPARRLRTHCVCRGAPQGTGVVDGEQVDGVRRHSPVLRPRTARAGAPDADAGRGSRDGAVEDVPW